MHELSKGFWFGCSHTLAREIGTESSARIHGHDFKAFVTLIGEPDPETGMLVDIGHLERKLAEVRDLLHGRFLNDMADVLGPGTMENLAVFIWKQVAPDFPGLSKVTLTRESALESCTYFGPAKFERSAGR